MASLRASAICARCEVYAAGFSSNINAKECAEVCGTRVRESEAAGNEQPGQIGRWDDRHGREETNKRLASAILTVGSCRVGEGGEARERTCILSVREVRRTERGERSALT